MTSQPCQTNKIVDVEIELRSKCRKLKVCESLSGAHLYVPAIDGRILIYEFKFCGFTIQSSLLRVLCFSMFPTESIAVRVYYPNDVEKWEKHLRKKQPSTAKDIEKLLEAWHGGNGADELEDVDGVVAFRKSFQFSVVIFVLPQGSVAYLSRPDSFVHRVQNAMCPIYSPDEVVLRHSFSFPPSSWSYTSLFIPAQTTTFSRVSFVLDAKQATNTIGTNFIYRTAHFVAVQLHLIYKRACDIYICQSQSPTP